MNRGIIAICSTFILVSAVFAIDPPKMIKDLFGDQMVIPVEQAKAAKTVAESSANALTSRLDEINAREKEIMERYNRVRRMIESLQQLLVQINEELVSYDIERRSIEEQQEEAVKSNMWLDTAIKDAEADKAAEIPLDATAYIEYIERNVLGGEK